MDNVDWFDLCHCVDADDNHPIEGARVSLGGLDNQTPDPALTDSDGYVAFSINFGQSVAVTVTAEKDEYVQLED